MPAMALDVPSMGSITRVSSAPLSTYPISSLRMLSGSFSDWMYIRAAFSATLSIWDVGVPSAPMHTSSPLHFEPGIFSMAD